MKAWQSIIIIVGATILVAFLFLLAAAIPAKIPLDPLGPTWTLPLTPTQP